VNHTLQQFAQAGRTGLVQSRTQSHLDGFQIQLAALAAVLKDQMKQTTYFAGNFALDRFRRFFSCGVRVLSTGRNWQMPSLTTTTFPHSS